MMPYLTLSFCIALQGVFPLRVRCRFMRQRCNVEATEQYVGSAGTVVVRDLEG